MADPQTFGDEPHSVHAGTATLVEGSALCISGQSGDIRAGGPQGLFFRDTRFVSGLELRINDQRPEPLAAERTSPFSATFVLRSQPPGGQADSSMMIVRHRYVGRGMREDLVLRNLGEEPAYCSLQLRCSADFANLFAVKEGRLAATGRWNWSGRQVDCCSGPRPAPASAGRASAPPSGPRSSPT